MRDRPREHDTPDEGDRHRGRQPERFPSGTDKMAQILRMQNPDFDEARFRKRMADAKEPRLPDVENVTVDRRKFVDYSMDPDNPRNQGKWKAWGQLGYDVANRRDEAADDVIRQIKDQLPNTRAHWYERSDYGHRYRAEFDIEGPNGKHGTLQTRWQKDNGTETPRLHTNWLQVHREGRDDR